MKLPTVLLSLNELEENNPQGIDIEGVSLVIVKQQDQIQVFDGKCPHQGTLLSEGWVADGNLVCRTHQWKFDCLSGEKVKDAKVCLKKFTSKVENNQVWIDRDEVLAFKHKNQQSTTAHKPQHIDKKKFFNALPGPKGLPFLGNLFQIESNGIHRTIEKWSEEYGTLFKMNLGKKYFLISTDPELNLHVLKIRPQSVSRNNHLHTVLEEFGVIGVFNAEGEQWKRQRQFVMQGLANKHLRQFFPIIVHVTQRLLNRWKDSAETTQVIDIQNDLMRYTVDVTTNLAFGYDMNTLEKEKDLIQEHLEVVFPAIYRRILAVFPYWRYFKLPQDRKLDKAIIEIRKFIDKILADSKHKIEQNPDLLENPSNFLEALLVAKDEDGSTFDDDEIYSNVLTMLLAGEDTTANTISWMAYYLTEYPEIAMKIRKEVDQVLGDKALVDDFALSKELSYIDAFALETLRFKPVAPLNGTFTLEDITFKDVVIPKGTTLVVASRPGTRLASHYESPDSFKPERWLDPEFRKKDRYNMPFGSGPRLCPGRSLALLEIKVAVAMLVKNFDLERVDTQKEVKEHLAFTMMPKNLSIRLKPRKEKVSQAVNEVSSR